MQIVVLGSAAGGGFPQWNCRCPNCLRARSGDVAAKPRTQCSLAISADGVSWFVLNASPDLRQQILAAPFLQPRRERRDSPIAGVVLSNADIDHVAGLLTLREDHAFVLHASGRVLRVLEANPIFDVLDRDRVIRRPLPLDRPVPLTAPDGPAGLDITLFGVPGKVARYLEDPAQPGFGTQAGDTVGMQITHQGRSLFYVPGCADIDEALAARLKGAELLFFDGTLWHDSEMVEAGLGRKTGSRMGHVCIDGDAGSLRRLAALDVGRKVYIHVNNTNPILIEDSRERQIVGQAGWEVAYDGMQVTL